MFAVRGCALQLGWTMVREFITFGLHVHVKYMHVHSARGVANVRRVTCELE